MANQTAQNPKVMILPATRGTCAMCATKHDQYMPHNLQSMFYVMRFILKYGRNPTWADACGHLTDYGRETVRTALRNIGIEWTEVSKPVAEPYAISDP